jgi:hypothetical protein
VDEMSFWSEIQEAYGITIITKKKVRDVYCLTTEENGILCLKSFHIIDYENTSMNVRMLDFSHILHRNLPWRGEETMRWIEYYDSKRSLSAEDRYLLNTLLLIPYPVVRATLLKRHPRNFVPTVRTIKNYKHELNRLL